MLIEGPLLPTRIHLRADVAVIGAGPAGITVAAEVAAAGHQVVLLEAGGRRHTRADDDALSGTGSGVPFPLVRSRQRGFGGTSGHWTPATGLRIRELDEVDFEARSGRDGSWPFGPDELAPYYDRAHASVGCEPGYSPDRWHESSPLAWADGPELAMFQFADHDVFVRRFDELVAHPRIDVVLHANVRTIVTSDAGEVKSLEVVCPDGNEFYVDATVLVLAAGGVDNARVLLGSPGPTGGGVGNQNDNVGRWFQDHLSVDSGIIVPMDGSMISADVFLEHRDGSDRHQPMLWLGNEVIRRHALPNAAFWVNDIAAAYMSAGVGATRSLKNALITTPRRDIARRAVASVRGLPDVVRYAATKFRPTSNTALGLRLLTEQLPDRDSRITLSSERDDLGVPRVDINWKVSSDDLATVRRHQDVLATMLESANIGTVTDRFDPDRHPSPVMSNYHHIGSTRMNPDARHGVVDGDCRVHGSPNLFVAGSSVFPTGGYLNPTLTIIALAHRIADTVVRELQPAPITPAT